MTKTLVAVTPRGFRQTPGPHQTLLQEHGLEVRYPTAPGPLRADELADLLVGCRGAILGLDDANAAVLEGSSLQVLVRYGTGVDNVDLEAARRHGIRVSRTLGANTTSVAELTMSLMLAAARRVPEMDRAAHAGVWSRPTGLELAGRTLGLVGVGRVGLEVAARARAFGMLVIGFDPVAISSEVTLVDFATLLARSDVISIHAPLTAHTRHLFDAAALGSMRESSILVNTARGGIVDEAALAAALRDGPLFAAALDCLEVEPPSAGHPLLGIGNLILTPHAGASTREAVVRAGTIAVQEVLRGLAGDPLLFEVG